MKANICHSCRADVFLDLYYYIVDHGYVTRTVVAVLMGVGGLEIIVSHLCLWVSKI